MSGEPRVVLAATVEPLVRVLARVVEATTVDVALIGGLAVACRLGVAHRPTGDADLVADETTRGVAAAVVVSEDLAINLDPLLIEGTKVEIIDTAALDDAALDGIDAQQQLFLGAHRWAWETAAPMHIDVADSDAAVTLPVATPAALVAAKLHPLLGRGREARKRASDAYDLFRLLDGHFGQVVDAVRAAPYGLDDLVADGVRRLLVDDVDRVVHTMKVHGGDAWRQPVAQDLRSLATLFGERLTDPA